MNVYGKLKKLHLYTAMIFGSKRKKYLSFSDQELIQLYIQEKCEHTIPILYERYAHLVMGSCLKYLKQLENAEDITLRIFGELGDKLLKHEIQHFKSWLYQVTKNECLQFLRKNKMVTQELMDQFVPDESSDLSVVFEKEQQLELLEQAIATLKDEQRTCVELFYLKQLSYQEISETLAISQNTVKSAIQNGKRNIKIWMEKNEKGTTN